MSHGERVRPAVCEPHRPVGSGTGQRRRPPAVVFVAAAVLAVSGVACGTADEPEAARSSTTIASRGGSGSESDGRRPGTSDSTAPGEAAPKLGDGPRAEETPLDELPAGEKPAPDDPPEPKEPPPPPGDPVLREGAEGPAVAELQLRLASLGYWVGDGGARFGELTSQAVMAFQKVEGIERDGIAGPVTRVRLAAARRPAPIGIADGVEIDLARQVLFVVQGGQVVEVHNTSTGRSGWSTPPGLFRVNRQIDGMRYAPLGNLWRPKYFNGGIAVHGSGSIPAEPASHGCARVSMTAMDHLWDSGRLAMGSPVVVY